MNLRDYLSTRPQGSSKLLAKRLGITAVYLSQLASPENKRVASAALCVSIERETERHVTRRDLRPDDWHLIWPELTDEQPAAA